MIVVKHINSNIYDGDTQSMANNDGIELIECRHEDTTRVTLNQFGFMPWWNYNKGHILTKKMEGTYISSGKQTMDDIHLFT